MTLLNKCNKAGATIVIATHDESIYRHTSHRIMELRKGRLHGITGGVRP
jgi:cell division transport system ATP-binding protein